MFGKLRCWLYHRRGFWVDWWTDRTEGFHDAIDTKTAKQALEDMYRTCPELVECFSNFVFIESTRKSITMIDPSNSKNRLEVRKKDFWGDNNEKTRC